MVKQAAEQLKPVMSKVPQHAQELGTTLSIDNSVIDRCGKLLRWSMDWYSGRYIKSFEVKTYSVCVHHPSHSIPFACAVLSKQGGIIRPKPM